MKQAVSLITRRFIGLCLLASLLTACGATGVAATSIESTPTAATAIETSTAQIFPTVTPIPYEGLVHLFDYDRTEALDYREIGVVDMGDAQVRDISYASPNGGQVSAFLVTPPGNGPFAAIVFLHRGGSNRRYFLDEALKYARMGTVSLLLDDNFSPTGKARDYKRIIQIVNDVRRGVDLLTTRSDVDSHRIGFVGFSYGANLGGVLAGVEKRIAAYVFMSGNGRMSRDLIGMFNMSEEVEAQYLGYMAQLDGIHFIGHAAPATLLFQNARKDALNPEQEALDFQQAASEPKVVKWYNAYHQLNPAADQDRGDWLREQLHLKALPQSLGSIDLLGHSYHL